MKNWEKLRPFIFFVAAVFAYAGSVNYGAMDLFPALPFVFLIGYAAFRWGRRYVASAAFVALVCVPLYILKNDHGPLFHPALGREFVSTGDVCLTAFRSGFIMVSAPIRESCDASNVDGADSWEIMPKGTNLKVSRVSISNADFGEVYIVHAVVPLGEISIYGSIDQFVWLDGKPLRGIESRPGLWNPIFFYPSMLMYWPMAPVVLLTMLSQVR